MKKTRVKPVPWLESEDQDTSRLEWPALLLNDMAVSGPDLQLRAMSEFEALLQSGFALLSNATITIEGSTDTPKTKGQVSVSG